jgi:hypothetical protein
MTYKIVYNKDYHAVLNWRTINRCFSKVVSKSICFLKLQASRLRPITAGCGVVYRGAGVRFPARNTKRSPAGPKGVIGERTDIFSINRMSIFVFTMFLSVTERFKLLWVIIKTNFVFLCNNYIRSRGLKFFYRTIIFHGCRKWRLKD